jgi:hypothetical protein
VRCPLALKKLTDVSQECTASIFRTKEKVTQRTDKKQTDEVQRPGDIDGKTILKYVLNN